MSQSLILVEHNVDFNNFQNYSDSKFISFDIIAHKKLENLGITNYLIEDYISEDDKSLIDEKTIQICYQWYEQKSISKYLEYDGVNLGWLLEIELFSYIVQSIKKFIGIIRLLEKENPTEIYCSKFLSSMINEISSNNNIILKIIPTSSKSLLYFDNVEIPINIGSKLFSIKISRESALKIKKFIEKFFNIFLNFKINLKKLENKNNLLFLDFNPILYQKMFNEFSKTNLNIILLNERRPAVFNYSGFKLLKELNCKIVVLQDLVDFDTSKKIKIEQESFLNKLKDIFSNDDFFINYFSIMGFSFWPTIKEDFISICNNRFNEAIQRLILSKKLFSHLEIEKIIVLYNTGVEEKAILSQSNKKNIHGLLIQHGYTPKQGEYNIQYIDSNPIIPKLGLKNVVWGNYQKSLLTNLNVPEKDVKVFGSVRHDDFFKKNISSQKNKIVFLESVSNEVDFVSFDSNNYLKNEKIIKKIISYVNNLSDNELIVKLHPGKYSLPYSLKPLIKSVDPTIPIYQSGNILNSLKNCKVVIASEMTTGILEAMILKIPTLLYLSHPKSAIDEDIFKNKASIRIETFEQFKLEIDKLLNDDDYRKMIINNGTKFINEYFSNPGNSCETFVKSFQK